jgi:hypothetical protein
MELKSKEIIKATLNAIKNGKTIEDIENNNYLILSGKTKEIIVSDTLKDGFIEICPKVAQLLYDNDDEVKKLVDNNELRQYRASHWIDGHDYEYYKVSNENKNLINLIKQKNILNGVGKLCVYNVPVEEFAYSIIKEGLHTIKIEGIYRLVAESNLYRKILPVFFIRYNDSSNVKYLSIKNKMFLTYVNSKNNDEDVYAEEKISKYKSDHVMILLK